MYGDDRAPTTVLEPVPDEPRRGHHAPAAGWMQAADSVRRTFAGHKVVFAAAGIVLAAASVFGGHLARLAVDADRTPPVAAATTPPTGDTTAPAPARRTVTPKKAKPRAHGPALAPRPRRTRAASPTPKPAKTTTSPAPSPSRTTEPPSPTPSASSEPPPGSPPPPPIEPPPGETE